MRALFSLKYIHHASSHNQVRNNCQVTPLLYKFGFISLLWSQASLWVSTLSFVKWPVKIRSGFFTHLFFFFFFAYLLLNFEKQCISPLLLGSHLKLFVISLSCHKECNFQHIININIFRSNFTSFIYIQKNLNTIMTYYSTFTVKPHSSVRILSTSFLLELVFSPLPKASYYVLR